MDARVDACIARSERWPAEMARLREVLLGCGLREELKWGKPCYVAAGGNIAIMQQMRAFLALMLFRGALIADPAGVLEAQGPHSRSARRMRFASVADVDRLADVVRAYVAEAVEVERAGLRVERPAEAEPCAELRRRLDEDPALRAAFAALTPGRRREYAIFVGGAKQASTRAARVAKVAPGILEGRGLRERRGG